MRGLTRIGIWGRMLDAAGCIGHGRPVIGQGQSHVKRTASRPGCGDARVTVAALMKRLAHCALRPAACALAVLAGLATPGPAAAAGSPPFPMNGWQFHDYNLPKLEEAIRRAPGYGVNFLIFSHELFRSVEAFLASDDDADPRHPTPAVQALHKGENFRIIPGWKSDLRHLGDLAAKQGLAYYLWVHEFDDLPARFIKGGRVDMDDPALFPYLEQRYERLLAAMPGAAGFVLTLHESDLRVFRNTHVASADDVPTRIRKVSRLLYDVLKRHGKQLIVRNFFYEPLEMEYFAAAIAALPDDVIIMSKDTAHEFHPFYPWDPLHGKVGKKRQIIEIDLGVEKAWDGHGAYAQTDYIRRVVLRARETHVTGLVGRARLGWDQPFEDSHEVNLYAFSRFLADPDLAVDRVLGDWAGRRYPARAAPYLARAFARTEMINHRGRWHLGYWLTKEIGREWGDYAYVYSRVLQRSRFKWTHDPADKALEEKLYHPDEATLRRALAEKDEVVAEVAAALGDLRQASRYLTAAQLGPLREDFRFLEDAALLQREWIRAYFTHRMFIDHPTPELRRAMEAAIAKLEQLERTPGVSYGANPGTGRRYNIDVFVRELRRRSADVPAARTEDQRILDITRRAADVANL
jgi:hypothetical protein